MQIIKSRIVKYVGPTIFAASSGNQIPISSWPHHRGCLRPLLLSLFTKLQLSKVIQPSFMCQEIKQKLIHFGLFQKKNPCFFQLYSYGIPSVRAPNIKQRWISKSCANYLIEFERGVSYSSFGKTEDSACSTIFFKWRFPSCQAETDCKLHPNSTDNIHQQVLGTRQLPAPGLWKSFSNQEGALGHSNEGSFPLGCSEGAQQCFPHCSVNDSESLYVLKPHCLHYCCSWGSSQEWIQQRLTLFQGTWNWCTKNCCDRTSSQTSFSF